MIPQVLSYEKAKPGRYENSLQKAPSATETYWINLFTQMLDQANAHSKFAVDLQNMVVNPVEKWWKDGDKTFRKVIDNEQKSQKKFAAAVKVRLIFLFSVLPPSFKLCLVIVLFLLYSDVVLPHLLLARGFALSFFLIGY